MLLNHRTQPGLLMKPGRVASLSHDFKYHGTMTFFAGFNTLQGTVIAYGQPQHRHAEGLDVLRQIDRRTPKEKLLHQIRASHATHKTERQAMVGDASAPQYPLHAGRGLMAEHGRALLAQHRGRIIPARIFASLGTLDGARFRACHAHWLSATIYCPIV
jgi:hypothetical protein